MSDGEQQGTPASTRDQQAGGGIFSLGAGAERGPSFGDMTSGIARMGRAPFGGAPAFGTPGQSPSASAGMAGSPFDLGMTGAAPGAGWPGPRPASPMPPMPPGLMSGGAPPGLMGGAPPPGLGRMPELPAGLLNRTELPPGLLRPPLMGRLGGGAGGDPLGGLLSAFGQGDLSSLSDPMQQLARLAAPGRPPQPQRAGGPSRPPVARPTLTLGKKAKDQDWLERRQEKTR